jgi:hypothetical protein
MTKDPDAPLLIMRGICDGWPVVVKAGERSECHRNVAKIWQLGKPHLAGIGSGYALSKDGLWRQHSWGLMREGVLETTESREKYFGVLYSDTMADKFAAAVLRSI